MKRPGRGQSYGDDGGSIRLYVRPLPDDAANVVEPTSIALYADEETYSAGVHLIGPGDASAMLDVSRGAYPRDEAHVSVAGQGEPPRPRRRGGVGMTIET